MISILGTIVGILIALAGIYYLFKAKDAESRKIYGITTAVGVIVAVVSVLL